MLHKKGHNFACGFWYNYKTEGDINTKEMWKI